MSFIKSEYWSTVKRHHSRTGMDAEGQHMPPLIIIDAIPGCDAAIKINMIKFYNHFKNSIHILQMGNFVNERFLNQFIDRVINCTIALCRSSSNKVEM